MLKSPRSPEKVRKCRKNLKQKMTLLKRSKVIIPFWPKVTLYGLFTLTETIGVWYILYKKPRGIGIPKP